MTTYFWLSQDRRVGNIQERLPDSLVTIRSKITGEIGYLPRLSHTTFAYDFDMEQEYDVLHMGLFMVTEKVKKVFDVVSPHLEYREFCITSNKAEYYAYYYVPIIPCSNIKFERISFPDRDHPYTNKLLLDAPIQSDIFKLSDSNGTYLMVSLVVAEQLLHVGAKNIRLIPAETFLNEN